MFYRLVGSPSVDDTDNFSDIGEDWYRNAVNWAAANGVINGTGGDRFSPYDMAVSYTHLIATDNNQLTMEIMQKVASKHGLVCLLHEKPFAGVNGSGKHNN